MKDTGFYQRMLEAKARKQKQLEQERLAAEFQVHPERFQEPSVKPDNEVKMDQAFHQLQIKLGTAKPVDQVQSALDHLNQKLAGL